MGVVLATVIALLFIMIRVRMVALVFYRPHPEKLH
jgi:hypothetical protein